MALRPVDGTAPYSLRRREPRKGLFHVCPGRSWHAISSATPRTAASQGIRLLYPAPQKRKETRGADGSLSGQQQEDSKRQQRGGQSLRIGHHPIPGCWQCDGRDRVGKGAVRGHRHGSQLGYDLALTQHIAVDQQVRSRLIELSPLAEEHVVAEGRSGDRSQ